MKNQTVESISLPFRPPVVSVLGHVDHGKTTLLDKIRNTQIAAKEHGGITQHIGAYQVEVKNPRYHKKFPSITFIDTPGHQAFVKMRQRGAEVADLAILVVAANDGVMPQTKESLAHIKAAKIPFLVALNKIDLPNINLEKIKKQLAKEGVSLEEYGGDTPVIPLSAKTGEGIDKLLEMILFLADLYQVKEKNPEKTQGVVIESSLSKNKGIVATVIVQSGKIKIGDEFNFAGGKLKVRALINWKGERLTEAKAGTPVQILGWETLPPVGVIIGLEEKKGKSPILSALKKPSLPPLTSIPFSPPEKKIKIILRTDTAGSLETLSLALKEKKGIEIISSQVGNITESDVFFAKTTQALILGFNLSVEEEVSQLAQMEKVLIKTYHLIYELLAELEEVLEMVQKKETTSILGEAKVIALFPSKKETVIAGVKVLSGRIAKGDRVKILRQGKEIGRSKIKSLRHFKEDVQKILAGNEAGVLLSPSLSLLTNDSIIAIG